MLSIEEAIARERKEAKNRMAEYENHYDKDSHYYLRQCKRLAEEHEQYADWLKELSRRRVEELFRKTNEKAIRDKAIDDFQEWIKTQIVGLDNTTNEILVAVDDRWELAIDKFKERVSND